MTPTLDVQGLTVRIEGQGPTVVMLHGWPDTLALWDGTVAALQDQLQNLNEQLGLSQPGQP